MVDVGGGGHYGAFAGIFFKLQIVRGMQSAGSENELPLDQAKNEQKGCPEIAGKMKREKRGKSVEDCLSVALILAFSPCIPTQPKQTHPIPSRPESKSHLPLIHPPWWPNNRPGIPAWPHLVAGAENGPFYSVSKLVIFFSFFGVKKNLSVKPRTRTTGN